jgi:glucokinase
MQEGVVGVDLGGTLTKIGLVTRDGRIVGCKSIPTDSSLPYQTFFEQLYDQVGDLKKSVGKDISLKGIGIGAPTGNQSLGTIEDASNLDWPEEVPVAKVLGSYSDLPTVLTNDANAAAVGEMLYGAARGLDNFITITLGTGLGCGIVANGKLVTGHNGHAGEIGHTTVYFDGRPCSCGRQGCLETYVSAPGLVHTVQILMQKTDTKSVLREIPASELLAEKITEAARQDDPLALEAFEYTGRILGLKLSDIVACVNPERIIVSGGLAKAGSLILDPAKKSMEEQMLNLFKNGVEVFVSSLAKKNMAILGAAAFAWNELESNGRI